MRSHQQNSLWTHHSKYGNETGEAERQETRQALRHGPDLAASPAASRCSASNHLNTEGAAASAPQTYGLPRIWNGTGIVRGSENASGMANGDQAPSVTRGTERPDQIPQGQG